MNCIMSSLITLSMKMLAKATAIFVPMAVPIVPANWNKFSCRINLSACLSSHVGGSFKQL